MIVSVSDSGPSGPPGPLEIATPPHYSTQVANCAEVLEKLPIDLGKLKPRIVHTKPESPAVVAWGDPAVVLQCGVDRPKALHPGSSKEFFPGGDADRGPFFDVTKDADSDIWTSVDRAVYISVTIPSAYQGSDVMPSLSRAIGTALPAVCAASPATGVARNKLCAERP